MPKLRFLRAYLQARDAIRAAEAKERHAVIDAATRREIKTLFEGLPAARQAEMVASVLSSSDITDAMLRRFVQACPQDKHIEISFINGSTVVISGNAVKKSGPGW